MNASNKNQTNPYIGCLDTIVEKIKKANDPYAYARSLQKDEYTHIKKGNEWVHSMVASHALSLAYAFVEPQSRWFKDIEALELADKTLNLLVDMAVDDRWYHKEPGMGDKNIDRFTALPVLECVQILGDSLNNATRKRILDKLDAILQVQLVEYGKLTRIYPNMDAYYCLIMYHGFSLLGNKEYEAEYSRFSRKMVDAQFDDGAWTYVSGMNECPAYHDINVLLMGRLATFAESEQAMKMIEKSIPYYQQIVSSNGIAENYTDPWWKHMWNDQNSFGADVVSSLTGDGRNRWIGDILRDTTVSGMMAGKKSSPILLVYAAAMWKDVTPEPVMDDTITYDANIEGPRGRFSTWSWAASARYGSDTIVGAVSNKLENGEISSLLGIRPEIPYRPDGGEDDGMDRLALGVTPKGCKGETSTTNNSALFDVTYRMCTPRTIWEKDQFPLDWECHQRWEMSATKLVGKIEVVSRKDQKSCPPVIRIRLGRDKSIEEKGNGEFIYNDFTIKASGEKFPNHSIAKSKTMPCRKVYDASDIIFSAGDSKRKCEKGETFTFSIEIKHNKRREL